MMTYERMEVQLKVHLTYTLSGSKSSVSRPGRFIPRNISTAHLTGGSYAPEPVWALWRRENLMPPTRIEPLILGRPYRRVVAIQTELSPLKKKKKECKNKIGPKHCTYFLIHDCPWLRYLSNEIDCCLEDHCWLLNIEQQWNRSDQ
jgi:hypothetical protein